MSEENDVQVQDEDLVQFMKREPIVWIIGAISASTLVVGLEIALSGRLSRLAISIIDKIGMAFIVVAVGLALFVTVKAIINRKFARIAGAWGSLLLMTFAAMIICSALDFWAGIVDDDHFADDLKLPQGVELCEPKAMPDDHKSYARDGIDTPESPKNGSCAAIVLHDYGQGGIYQSEIWANPHEAGKLYLKAYEMTGGDQLSGKSLAERSRMEAGFDADENHLFFTQCKFTIYEGNWGQYYGARFELWFKPASGKPERKLAEANYKIQGWQR